MNEDIFIKHIVEKTNSTESEVRKSVDMFTEAAIEILNKDNKISLICKHNLLLKISTVETYILREEAYWDTENLYVPVSLSNIKKIKLIFSSDIVADYFLNYYENSEKEKYPEDAKYAVIKALHEEEKSLLISLISQVLSNEQMSAMLERRECVDFPVPSKLPRDYR